MRDFAVFDTEKFQVVSTLISAGLSKETIQSGHMKELYAILRQAASKNDGLIGFGNCPRFPHAEIMLILFYLQKLLILSQIWMIQLKRP